MHGYVCVCLGYGVFVLIRSGFILDSKYKSIEIDGPFIAKADSNYYFITDCMFNSRLNGFSVLARNINAPLAMSVLFHLNERYHFRVFTMRFGVK